MRAKLMLLALPFLFALVFAGDPPAPAGEAEVLENIDKGREAFKAGKSHEAIDHLQKAISLIQKASMANLATFLPTRDEKVWEMGEIESTGGNWGTGEGSFQWTQVSRRYTKKGVEDGPEVTVQISNWPQMIEAQRAAFEPLRDPATRAMMAKLQPDVKLDFIDKDGWIGTITTQKEDCAACVTHTKVIVTINANKGDDKLVKEFWDAMDSKALGEATSK